MSSCGEHPRPEERRLGAVRQGEGPDLRVVGGDEDAVHAHAGPRGGDAPREERDAGQRADVLPREGFRPSAGGDQGEDGLLRPAHDARTSRHTAAMRRAEVPPFCHGAICRRRSASRSEWTSLPRATRPEHDGRVAGDQRRRSSRPCGACSRRRAPCASGASRSISRRARSTRSLGWSLKRSGRPPAMRLALRMKPSGPPASGSPSGRRSRRARSRGAGSRCASPSRRRRSSAGRSPPSARDAHPCGRTGRGIPRRPRRSARTRGRGRSSRCWPGTGAGRGARTRW